MESIKDYFERYSRETLEKGGFNPDELTEDQRWAILEPTEGPENYMCDGEITPKQAFKYWKERLRGYGLTEAQIKKAVKLNFG